MKKFIIIPLLLLMLFDLVGCHSKKVSTGFTVPESFDETKNYEITFWAKNDNNVNQVNVYKKAIEDFEKVYPNIKVNLSLYTDYTRIYNDVITNISTGTTPNVCITYPDHIATYLKGDNTVVNLDTLIDDEKYGLGGKEVKFDVPLKEEMVEKFLNEGILNGGLYALPFMRSTECLYINEDFVNKLGYEIPEVITWDFVFEVSKKAIETKNNDGTYFVNNSNILIPFIYKSTDNMMIQMLKQKEAPYSNENGEILIFNDETKDILNTIADSARIKAFSTFKISSYPGNFLNAGECIFAIDSSAGSTWMGSSAPLIDIPEEKLVDFNTVVKEIPQYDVDNIKMISQGPSICIFNKDDNNEVLASWLFAEFLLTNDVQFSYSKTEGYVPVTKKCQNTKEYLDYINSDINDEEHYKVKLEATKLLIDNTNNTFVTPVFNGSASLRNAAGQLVEETVKAINRKKEVNDNFYDELFDNINSLYHLDQNDMVSTNKDLGELPKESKILLISIVVIWLLIGTYYVIKKTKKKKL